MQTPPLQSCRAVLLHAIFGNNFILRSIITPIIPLMFSIFNIRKQLFAAIVCTILNGILFTKTVTAQGIFSLIERHYSTITGFSYTTTKEGKNESMKIFDFKINQEQNIIRGYANGKFFPAETQQWVYHEIHYNDQGNITKLISGTKGYSLPKDLSDIPKNLSERDAQRQIAVFEYDQAGNETLYSFWAASDGQQEATTFETAYNDRGQPTERSYCYLLNGQKGKTVIKSWHYNTDGKLAEIKTFDRSSKPDGITQYEYDADHTLKHERHFRVRENGSHGLVGKTDFEYFSDGRIHTRRELYSWDGTTKMEEITYNMDSKESYGDIQIVPFFKQFDALKNKETVRIDIDNKQVKASEIHESYNEFGLKIESKIENFKYGPPVQRIKTFYR